ncbi:glycosyl transferase family 2 [Paramagnetospirillum magnetotacticum MS-1]|uniref:Glycosyl transferase family 2 n=1 Tax=Paramagnetospirillum magnetotacticum MS-1 TaxID=272627 RepID=A0A0C2Z1F4_PARME|nr:bifunctional glycosyltransferase/class I SAM-dependent methyltransferase [Paramagnetospirillum magnetotacticum]KIM00751.1 glycosyl transferase family 2 [Paramagnetospirillum magnetotacticum MS-1]
MKKRLLAFIVAYNAEKTISAVFSRIPASLTDHYDVEVLAIDDASPDDTFRVGYQSAMQETWPFPITVLRNPVNQGYGGNQKIGFFYAMENGFDYVALIHGDGQYAPECLPELVAPLAEGQAEAVMGSRMMTHGGARQGGMPLYKFVGNKILTFFQNTVLGLELTEFHSGYRLYSVAALRTIPFHLNTNDFHFDTQIIIQLQRAGQRIRELPIPTYYGDEICHVNGMKYAWDVVCATSRARLNDFGLVYDRLYDCRPAAGEVLYESKLDFDSPHTVAASFIRDGETVLELGCGEGDLAAQLTGRGCDVTGLDLSAPKQPVTFKEFIAHDLNTPLPPGLLASKQKVVMLDIIEHLASPEAFVDRLHGDPDFSPQTELLVSTGNVGFLVVRLGLLFGLFNYGKRGILDMTHTRLYTFATIRHLFEQSGFEVKEIRGIPAPFPLALGRTTLADLLLTLNRWAIRVWPGLFAYQIFLRAQKRPTLKDLLAATLDRP